MFKLQPNPTFTAKVGITVAGQIKPAEVEFEFKHLSRKQVSAFFDRLRDEKIEDAEALGEIVVGWKGIDQPYSAETLATLLDNYPAAARDLFAAFSRELMESRAKN